MDYNQALKELTNLYKQKKYKETKTLSQNILKKFPKNSSIWYILALCEYYLENFEESLNAFNHSAKEYQTVAGWHIDYANLLFSISKLKTAHQHYLKVIEIEKNRKRVAMAYNGIGNVYCKLDKFDHAIEAYNSAIENDPKDMGYVNNLAEVYKKTKNFDKAYKLHQKALYEDENILDETTKAFRHFQLASFLHFYTKGNGEKILKHLSPFIHFSQHKYSGYIADLALYTKLKLSDWSELEPLLNQLHKEVKEKRDTLSPFRILQFPSFSEAEHLFVAKESYRKSVEEIKKRFPPRPLKPLDNRILNIAFVSSDIASEHPVYQVIKGVLRHLKRNRVQIDIYSIDDKRDKKYREYMKRVLPLCHRLYDMNSATDLQIATQIYKNQTDVLIDLNGFTKGVRPKIFAYYPAPIIVNWLGYPSTVGSRYHNWIIGDKYVTPLSSQKYFSERIWQMPTSYFPTDNEIPIPKPTTRESANLPTDKFIFAGFSNSYKINPTTFDAWCDILKAVPNSILWLREYTDTNKENLYMEAKKRGVERGRVIFAKFTPTVEEHYARIQLADLALDTSPYNMHATAIDFLYMGVPVLTLKGHSFASRVGESFSHAIDMPDMIMADYKSYTQKAIEIASNPDLHQELKERTKKSRISSPLFDTKKMAKELEEAFREMYQIERLNNEKNR